jgi:F1F0 ATPase subunit 2
MNEGWILLLAGVTGFALGAVFLGGLRWTLSKGLASPRPALWFLGSILTRMCLLLAVAYHVGDGGWDRLVVLLFGFMLARHLVLRCACGSLPDTPFRAKEVSHAP